LLGPTGVGKTETAKALAQHLFGWEGALTRINCEEYAHGHELSKLLGAPPGYVGHGLEPLLSQARIDGPHQQARREGTGSAGDPQGPFTKPFRAEQGACLSIVLFDEIEKVHPVLWNAMLGILEGGHLTLGDNSVTDFTRSIIVMTSNVGSRDLGALLDRRQVGFRAQGPGAAPQEVDLKKVALGAAREMFPLEFLNRFDDILVYTSLDRRHLEAIFEKFLREIHVRALLQAGMPLLIQVGRQAKELILDRGTDPLLGARPLRRAIEVELVDPLSRLIASGRLTAGDIVEVERNGEQLLFYRKQNGASAPGSLEIPGPSRINR
jgi:ATP-dependent Clp protease ATP-binding subunit ClpC